MFVSTNNKIATVEPISGIVTSLSDHLNYFSETVAADLHGGSDFDILFGGATIDSVPNPLLHTKRTYDQAAVPSSSTPPPPEQSVAPPTPKKRRVTWDPAIQLPRSGISISSSCGTIRNCSPPAPTTTDGLAFPSTHSHYDKPTFVESAPTLIVPSSPPASPVLSSTTESTTPPAAPSPLPSAPTLCFVPPTVSQVLFSTPSVISSDDESNGEAEESAAAPVTKLKQKRKRYSCKEDREINRRERNREHAKKSRQRRKETTKVLQESVEALMAENEKLRSILQIDGDEDIKKSNDDARESSTDNDVLLRLLQSPENRILGDEALSEIQSMFVYW